MNLFHDGHLSEEAVRALRDGLLESQQQLDALEHVALCPQCAARYADSFTEEQLIEPPKACLLYTSKIFDAGYKFSDCLYDYDKMADAMYKFHEKYDFDLYMDIGNRNPIKMLENFDAKIYSVDDENGYLNFVDRDDLDAPDGLIAMTQKGFYRCAYEDILPGKYNLKDPADAIKRLVAAAKEFKAVSYTHLPPV